MTRPTMEMENSDSVDVPPKSYHNLESRTHALLLKTLAPISMDKGGESEPDWRYLFGLIDDWSGATKIQSQMSPKGKSGGVYQYFLGKFRVSRSPKHTSKLVLA